MKFQIKSVNISGKKGVEKHPVDEAVFMENFGIQGDAHGGDWHRQISFLAVEAVTRMQHQIDESNQKLSLDPGIFAENILTEGIDWTKTRVGGRIFINNSVELEVTQIGKKCHHGCAIFKLVGNCIMPTQGIFAKVIKGGKVHAEDSGYYCI